MARRKARKMGKRGSFRGFSKRSRSSGSSSENLMLVGAGAVAYGALRSKVESLIAPVTSKIPIGGAYVDEIFLGTLGYFTAKGKMPLVGNNKYAKAVGKAIFIVECTRVGSGLGSQYMSNNGSSGSGNATLG
jgi:hypothetical protein